MHSPQSTQARVSRGARFRALLRLHRSVGIISALFVLLLSVTGVLLNHSARYSLDEKYIASSGMLNWYGIEVTETANTFTPGEHKVTHIADRIYFDTKALPGRFADVAGVTRSEFGFAIATSEGIVLLTDDGELIEVLSALHGVPEGIRQIGVGPDASIYVEAEDGILRANFLEPDFLLQNLPPEGIIWSQPGVPEAELLQGIRQDFAGTLLNWERMLLDIHSGRILGNWGIVLVDVMALLFVFMASTGVWIWLRRRS